MIDDTIQRIEARLRNAGTLPDATRAELLQLLATLRSEAAQLAPAHTDQAQAIARAADVSTAETLASQRDPVSHRLALEDLTASVHQFEDSHPKLVQVVNNIANTLSGLGI